MQNRQSFPQSLITSRSRKRIIPLWMALSRICLSRTIWLYWKRLRACKLNDVTLFFLHREMGVLLRQQPWLLLTILQLLIQLCHGVPNVDSPFDINLGYTTLTPSVPMCRNSSPSGHDLPAALFGLDACAWCYRYIPDVPAFFKRKWNHTWRSVALPGSSADAEGSIRLFNITYLVNSDDNRLVSIGLLLFWAILPSTDFYSGALVSWANRKHHKNPFFTESEHAKSITRLSDQYSRVIYYYYMQYLCIWFVFMQGSSQLKLYILFRHMQT